MEVKKVLLGIPYYRYLEAKTVMGLLQTTHTAGYAWDVFLYACTNVPEGRNMIANRFMEDKHEPEFLFFLDADMAFIPEMVLEVLRTLEGNPDAGLVGGAYPRREPTLGPIVGWYRDQETRELLSIDETLDKILNNENPVMEADIIPTGFMAIKREVFKKIEKPWFNLDHKGPGGITRSSDTVFVEKVRNAGFKTLAHFGIDLGHIGDYTYTQGAFFQMAHTLRSKNQIVRIKQAAGQEHGWNTENYWDHIWDAERKLQMVRLYETLHGEILKRVQVKGKRVIDLGSGPGILGARLQDQGALVECWDHSRKALEIAKERGLETRHFNLLTDKLEPNDHKKADYVMLTEVLEHFEEPEKIVKIATSLLKKGGTLVVTTPNDRLGPEEEPEHHQKFTALKLSNLLKHLTDREVVTSDHYLLATAKKK